jgi:hypothetical protein
MTPPLKMTTKPTIPGKITQKVSKPATQPPRSGKKPTMPAKPSTPGAK